MITGACEGESRLLGKIEEKIRHHDQTVTKIPMLFDWSWLYEMSYMSS